MKKIIIIGLLILSFTNCQKKGVNIANDNHSKKEIDMEKTPVYTIKISAANPYEVLVNDMPFEKDYNNGSSTVELPINDLILRSGKQIIKIKILPNSGGNTVDQSGLNYFNLKVLQYTSVSSIGSNGKLIKEITLKDQKELPIVTIEKIVNLEVPYNVQGWSKSQDLAKEDKTVLKNEVLSKYQELKNVLNKGDLKSFLSENKIRDKEVHSAFYNDKEMKNEDEDYMKNRVKKSANHMAEIKDFQMKFYGNGKVVSLERNDGNSALFADDSNNLFYYAILLHRPKPGSPLEIIR